MVHKLWFCHERPDPNLPPVGDPEPRPPTPIDSRRRKLCCEFCDCELTSATGEVLKMSDKAKAYRDLKEKHEKLQAQLADLEAQHTALKSEHTALKTKTEKKGFWG